MNAIERCVLKLPVLSEEDPVKAKFRMSMVTRYDILSCFMQHSICFHAAMCVWECMWGGRSREVISVPLQCVIQNKKFHSKMGNMWLMNKASQDFRHKQQLDQLCPGSVDWASKTIALDIGESTFHTKSICENFPTQYYMITCRADKILIWNPSKPSFSFQGCYNYSEWL